MKINAKFVNPFIDAGMNVVKQIAGIDVRRGHLSYKGKPEPSYGVSIIIGRRRRCVKKCISNRRKSVF